MFPSKSKVASFVGSKTRKVGSAALSLMSKDQNEPVKSVAAVGSTSKSVTTEEDIPQAILDVLVKDESLQEAIKWITYLLGEKLEEHKLVSNVLIRRKKPLAVILPLIFKAHRLESTKHKWNYKPLTFEEKDFKELHRLQKMAIRVYKAVGYKDDRLVDEAEAREVLELLDEDEILLRCNDLLHLEGKQRCPQFMVFTDTRSESIVIAIRGTATRNDVVIDIVCVETDFLGGKAHKGMAEATLQILDVIKETLRNALNDHPGYRLFITGHSLGGGVGTLMAMAIRGGVIKDYVPADVALMCKVYAPPPVFFSEADVTHLTSDIEAYVQGEDCVPRFSLRNTAELFAMISAVDDTSLGTQQTIKILKGTQDESTTTSLKLLNENMEKARTSAKMEDYCDLQLVGQIFYIAECDYGSHQFRPRIFPVPNRFIDDNFLLLDRMVDDHKGKAYNDVFERIKYD